MKSAPTPPTALTPWLTQKGSITDQLKALTHHTRLEVLNHTWEAPDSWDLNTLKLPKDSKTLHREIIMWADKAPCWYARTILPHAVYDAEAALFDQLKTTPLGELIHHHKEIHRTQITPYEMHPEMPEYHYLKKALKQNTPKSPLWGRLSTFTIRKQFDFYLLEILLPDLLNY